MLRGVIGWFSIYTASRSNIQKILKGCHPVALFITEIKSKSVQTQLNLIYYSSSSSSFRSQVTPGDTSGFSEQEVQSFAIP
jgi:hypothetical protein